MTERINIGISSCLLGKKVRYDGGHKLDRYLKETLGQYLSYIPVCPEVECGLPIPREAMRLTGEPQNPRLVTNKTGVDHTRRMQAWARRRVVELEKEDLCGFIFKKDSPSSGMQRVKIYNTAGMPTKIGSGLFAKAFMDHFPLIPVEDEGRLHDPQLRENFVERIFALRRWREALASGLRLGALISFHTSEKLLLMAHSPKHYRMIGNLVAQGKQTAWNQLLLDYENRFLEALTLKATRAKHSNVLMHILGYFKTHLTTDEKQEMLTTIDHYRQGYIPLIVPITLVNHYVRKYKQDYLAKQTYLNPHPIALQLRNHV